MKYKFLFVVGVLFIVSMACNLPSLSASTPVANTSEHPTVTVAPVNTPTATGSMVTLNNVTITIPHGLAKDALTEMISEVTDPNAAPWEMKPAHLEFTLTSYQLQDKFQKPKLYIYPAQEFAADSGAAESIRRLQSILLNAAPLAAENLPFVPFFNAGQVFAAQMQIVQFQNGSGVRFLTEYAQSFATINNHELFYHFQGLSDDGKYYIIAILPVTAPILAADEKPDSLVPTEGVPFPGYDDPNADFVGYYNAVTEKLNALTEDDFQPSLSVLDALIRSMSVTP